MGFQAEAHAGPARAGKRRQLHAAARALLPSGRSEAQGMLPSRRVAELQPSYGLTWLGEQKITTTPLSSNVFQSGQAAN